MNPCTCGSLKAGLTHHSSWCDSLAQPVSKDVWISVGDVLEELEDGYWKPYPVTEILLNPGMPYERYMTSVKLAEDISSEVISTVTPFMLSPITTHIPSVWIIRDLKTGTMRIKAKG